MGGTTSVGALDTGTIGTMTNSSTLSAEERNTGDDISSGTMTGTVDPTHVVTYSGNTTGRPTSVGLLDTGTICTIARWRTPTRSSAKTGDSISIDIMDGTVDATHLVNYSVNTMGGTTSVGSLDTGTIGTMTNSSTL